MSDWNSYELKDIADIQTGPFGSLLHASDYIEFGIPSIMPTNIGKRLEINNTALVYIKQSDAKRLSKYLVNSGDIVYSRRGDVEKCAIITNKENGWLCGTGCLRVRITSEVAIPKFVALYLSTDKIKGWVSGHAVGTTMPNLNTNILGKVPIRLPTLAEQHAIASVFDSLENKIDLLQSQNTTLEKMAQTIFRQWFVEEANEGWKETKLQEHTDAFRGLSYKGIGLAEFGNGLPMHNLNSVYEGGGYKYEGIKFYTGEYKDRHIVYPGEIIVTNTEQGHEFRLIGYPAIVPGSFGSIGLFSQHIYKLVPKEDSYLTRQFIYYLLMTPDVREQIIAATNGSTVNMLAIDGLQRPEFKLPPQSLVEKFTDIVSAYWEKNELNQAQIRTLTTLRDTLLPKLMNGEVNVQIN